MIADAVTILWKEWRETIRQPGWPIPGWASILVAPTAIGAYAAHKVPVLVASQGINIAIGVGTMMMLGLVGETFAGERERRTLEPMLCTPLSESGILAGKVAAVLLYGWTAAALCMAAAFAWLSVTEPVVHIDGRSAIHFILSIPLALPGTSLIALAGVLVSLRCATVKQAQLVLYMSLMGLTVASLLLVGGLSSLNSPDVGEPSPIISATFAFVRWVRTDVGGASRPFVGAVLLISANVLLFRIALANFKRDRMSWT